ncbi:MAG: carboxypeptidase-like regulatory domain-containing protein [Thermoplasmatota archaeon]
MGFPCTSHVLSGDHYEEEDIQVTIDGSGIDHSWAYNDDIYYHPSLLKDKNSSEEVRGRNELMGFDERISEFIPIFDISPVLHNEGVEFLAYFNIEVEGKSTVRIDIDLTHFSGFACTGDCDHSNGHLKLDLDHSGHWDAPPMFDITIMNNSQPKITTSLNVTYDSSVYRLHGNDTSLPLDIRISPRIQTAEGYVFDEWGAPLPGVDIISDETGSRTISNVTGYFRIELGYFSSERITFSKVGYEAITLSFIDFEGEVFLKKK